MRNSFLRNQLKLVLLFVACFVFLAFFFQLYPISFNKNVSIIPSPSWVLYEPEVGVHRYTIVILSYGRPNSLSRLLQSLDRSNYENEIVDIRYVVDFADPDTASRLEMKENSMVRAMVRAHSWKHGRKFIHFRTKNAGLRSAWLEAWYPASDFEIGIIFEDDVQVTPLWFQYVLQVVKNFYHSNSDPQFLHACLLSFGNTQGRCKTKPSLVKVFHTCQQGLIANPRSWRAFIDYSTEAISTKLDPVLPVHFEPNAWLKKYKEGKVWTLLLFRFMFEHGYYAVGVCYPERWGTSSQDELVTSSEVQRPPKVTLVCWFEERGVNHPYTKKKTCNYLAGTPGANVLPDSDYLKYFGAEEPLSLQSLPLVTESWFHSVQELAKLAQEFKEA